MSHLNTRECSAVTRFLPVIVTVVALLLAASAYAAVPGITGPAFNLTAGANYLTQPDGAMVYAWGYGCTSDPKNEVPFPGYCPPMQVPGPTLIVTEGQTVTVTLTNNLPAPAGNTSILFSGFQVTSSGTGPQGLLTKEAVHGGTVTYQFVATTPGTHAYYSGTQPDLQGEMGLYGAVVVLPKNPPASCTALGSELGGRTDYRLAPSAYDHPATCYDREYLFQFAAMDPRIHRQAEEQVRAALAAGTTTALNVVTEPYHPSYFLINGRSAPDDMDINYAPNYPNQPYNGNPHMHPGELVLLRVIGQGRWQHPFHEHGNHVRILARDGNLILSQTDPTRLGGRMEFTTDTTPGQAFDGIFYWSGKGLNWDIYGHKSGDGSVCIPDADGYYTQASGAPANAPNYYEWCADHNHPLEANPAGAVAGGGPATLPDPLIATNGLWYNGTPYLGPEAVGRSRGPTPLPPGGALQNPPAESGIAFMWHSHNEREITTNDVFPGGMLMMMLVDPPVWFIDETL
jgi:FtsP/CotA-like multicopper oxidase with cupredoxin domain